MKFHLGDVLSITTGRLVSPRKIGGVYAILNFMTGDNLFTHQLPRACDECAPELLRQHPQLAAVVVPDLTPETWRAWLDGQATVFGEELEVAPLSLHQHERRDPVEEPASSPRLTRRPASPIAIHSCRCNSHREDGSEESIARTAEKVQAMLDYLAEHEVPFDRVWGLRAVYTYTDLDPRWLDTNTVAVTRAVVTVLGVEYRQYWLRNPQHLGKPVADVYLDDRGLGAGLCGDRLLAACRGMVRGGGA